MNVILLYENKEPYITYGRRLRKALEEDAHQVYPVKYGAVGTNNNDLIKQMIFDADMIIVLVSENGNAPYWDKSYVAHFRKKTIVPLVFFITFRKDQKCPEFDSGGWEIGLCTEGTEPEYLYRQSILDFLRYYLLDKEKAESLKRQKEKDEKVQTGLSNYLNDTMTRLKENEARNMILAYGLYGLSLVPLAVSIVIALRTSITNAENTIAMAVQAITAFFVILLFVSMSKLLFTLAKSFMVESIRCSDRIHAISFGKFFLDAYGNDATREEVLKAFNTWNIDDGKTTFRNQSGDDYDPKLENIISAVKDIYKSK